MSEKCLRSGVIFSKKERLQRQTAETAQGQEKEALRLDTVNWKSFADTASLVRMIPVCQGHGSKSQELNQSKKMQTTSASEGGDTAIIRGPRQRAQLRSCRVRIQRGTQGRKSSQASVLCFKKKITFLPYSKLRALQRKLENATKMGKMKKSSNLTS